MTRTSAFSLVITTVIPFGICVAGCAEKRPTRVPVSGTVTIDGAPLTFGSVMFVNADTRPAGSAIDGQGRFTLSCYEAADGAVLGLHRVKVTAAQPHGTNAVRWLAPKKYASENTSGIDIEITEPRDDLNIELTWDGGKPFIER
jgi:hypothetical protein